MKNKLIILKAYNGQPLIRRIFKIENKAIYVTDDSKNDGLVSIGFPLEDAFKYDPQLATSMERIYKSGKWDWKKLIPLFS